MRKIRINSRKTRKEFVEFLEKNGVAITGKTLDNYEAGTGVPWKTAVAMAKIMPWISLDYLYLHTIWTEEIRRIDAIVPEDSPYY